jgi:hypothetical protein
MTVEEYKASVRVIEQMTRLLDTAPDGRHWEAWRAMTTSLIVAEAQELADQIAMLCGEVVAMRGDEGRYDTLSLYAALGQFGYTRVDGNTDVHAVKFLLDLDYHVKRAIEKVAAAEAAAAAADAERVADAERIADEMIGEAAATLTDPVDEDPDDVVSAFDQEQAPPTPIRS